MEDPTSDPGPSRSQEEEAFPGATFRKGSVVVHTHGGLTPEVPKVLNVYLCLHPEDAEAVDALEAKWKKTPKGLRKHMREGPSKGGPKEVLTLSMPQGGKDPNLNKRLIEGLLDFYSPQAARLQAQFPSDNNPALPYFLENFQAVSFQGRALRPEVKQEIDQHLDFLKDPTLEAKLAVNHFLRLLHAQQGQEEFTPLEASPEESWALFQKSYALVEYFWDTTLKAYFTSLDFRVLFQEPAFIPYVASLEGNNRTSFLRLPKTTTEAQKVVINFLNFTASASPGMVFAPQEDYFEHLKTKVREEGLRGSAFPQVAPDFNPQDVMYLPAGAVAAFLEGQGPEALYSLRYLNRVQGWTRGPDGGSLEEFSLEDLLRTLKPHMEEAASRGESKSKYEHGEKIILQEAVVKELLARGLKSEPQVLLSLFKDLALPKKFLQGLLEEVVEEGLAKVLQESLEVLKPSARYKPYAVNDASLVPHVVKTVLACTHEEALAFLVAYVHRGGPQWSMVTWWKFLQEREAYTGMPLEWTLELFASPEERQAKRLNSKGAHDYLF